MIVHKLFDDTRAWLVAPGNRRRFLERALSENVSVVLIDLEDSVPADQKAEARSGAAEFIQDASRCGDSPILVVRINPLTTPEWRSDAAMAVLAGAHGVCLPKLEDPTALGELAEVLAEHEGGSGIKPGTTRIAAIVETPRGLENVSEILRSDQGQGRLECVLFGREDFAAELGLFSADTPEARDMVYARSAIAIAAAARGAVAVDAVFPSLDDKQGLERDSRIGRTLGFRTKVALHPEQVELINDVFAPSASEVRSAERILREFEAAKGRGEGSLRVDGAMIDLAVAVRARRVLNLALRDRRAD